MHHATLNRWWTVAAGALGAGVGVGVLVIYTFGAFAAEMAAEFGWSRSVHSNALTVFLVASGIGSLLLGQLMDRFGVRRVCAALVAAFGITVASLALIPPKIWVLYALFAVIGLTGSAATAMPYAVAIRALFDRERGLALGLVNFGAGIGSAIAPYCAKILAESFGWRGGYIGVGIAGLLPVLGLLLLVRDPASSRKQKTSQPQEGWLIQLGRPTFWLITIPVAAISIATFGVLGSMVPLLQDRELGAQSIAIVMSCVGVSSWIARPVVGYALDRAFAPYVAAASFVFAVGGLVLLTLTDHIAGTIAAAILVGFALGSEGDLVTFLVSRYYPPAIYSRVLGAVWVTWAWGGGIGTFLAGASDRMFGSYTPAIVVFAAMLTIGIIVVCRLGPYPFPAADKTATSLLRTSQKVASA
ncbi:MFS transporter [Peristeroidobacter soli]|jgi:predicted MFS family arabinose efflux permease|uniref:MFS transporter n=1 Tax=Peristeroidobacter soli TaxID=2497877 RepID=UPI0013003A2A|nr:MFS transporter [Peristeroidobacter soli]